MTVSKFRKRKRKLFSCVHVLHKTWIYEVSRCSRVTTTKKCTKKCAARAKLLFCHYNTILLICRFRCRRRRRCLSSLSKTRRRMTTAITFSRQNDAGPRLRATKKISYSSSFSSSENLKVSDINALNLQQRCPPYFTCVTCWEQKWSTLSIRCSTTSPSR